MTRTLRLLASASLLTTPALLAAPALAAGTNAGTTITNTVTLTHQVNGIDQAAISASDSFTVDRKINLVVAEDGSATTTVSPGQTSAVTSFNVTNSSNAPLDFALTVTQPSGGTAAHGGTDSFDVTNVRIYADTNNNGSFDAATDQLITYLDEVAADSSMRVFVVADVPLGGTSGAVAGVRLAATAAEGGGTGAQGAAVTQTSGANTAGVDTVFADSNTGGNTARDGIHFAEDDYTVSTSALTVQKLSRVVSDPLNGTTEPKMIPGAVVEYCVAVANAAGSATATNINLSDTLPGATTFDTGFGILVNGTMTGSSCNADGVAGGSHASGVVTAPLADIAAGVTRTMLFRVTLN